MQIDGLTKSFGRFQALSGVSFSTGTGVTGLLGPNGAGKTTLLRIAATVLAPDGAACGCSAATRAGPTSG